MLLALLLVSIKAYNKALIVGLKGLERASSIKWIDPTIDGLIH